MEKEKQTQIRYFETIISRLNGMNKINEERAKKLQHEKNEPGMRWLRKMMEGDQKRITYYKQRIDEIKAGKA